MSKLTSILVDLHNGDTVTGWEACWMNFISDHVALVDVAAIRAASDDLTVIEEQRQADRVWATHDEDGAEIGVGADAAA